LEKGLVNSTMTPSKWGRWLLLARVCLSFLAVVLYFLLERHSYYTDRGDAETSILESTFIPALLIGMVSTLVGGVMWARRASVTMLFVLAIAIAVVIMAAVKFVPGNVHGWTAIRGPVAGEFLLVALIFIVFGCIHLLRQRGRGR
jgi:Flp pilus assembly pilin Flp